jgi:type VI secretion system protein ImpA
MSVIDIEKYLADLPGERACGENLEYDPDFVELERLQQGKAEAQFGNTIIAAEPPDWKAMRKLALSLLERTRDLRVGVHLCRALLNVDGIVGFADGMALLSGLIERSWPLLHPQLDPDDGNDPVMRVNAIATLCDSYGTLNGLRDAYLAVAPIHGRFSLRDIDIANGEVMPAAGQEKPQLGAIHAAFMDMKLDALLDEVAAAAAAHGHAVTIEKALMRLVGPGQALDMSELVKLLGRIRDVTAERLAQRPDRPIEAVVAEEAPAAEGQAAGGSVAGSAPVARMTDKINSRDDVVKALGLILDYYRVHEPASPVPLLLERARRLVPLGFLDIIRELAPDHVAELEKLQGKVS